MELQIQLQSLAAKITMLKDTIQTEEFTKQAFVLPFISLLGYDALNPKEVVPEFTADGGLDKGQKVDYAIFQEGIPILIIECIKWKEDLAVHNSQLFRHFHGTKTRLALLTNGITCQFYTDIDEKNKMDKKPFLEFDISNLKDTAIVQIAKFHKSRFDVNTIVTHAISLKYLKEIRIQITDELSNPSNEFVKLYANTIYTGRLTEKVMDLVQQGFDQFLSEKTNHRLKAMPNKAVQKQEEEPVETADDDARGFTGEEELEGFRIVIAILRRKLPTSRIAALDTQSYFGILLDDNKQKPLCRLHLNGGNKHIGLFNTNKTEVKQPLQSLDDIYLFEKELLETVGLYEMEK